MMNKILTVVSIVLLVILLTEGGFMVFYKPKVANFQNPVTPIKKLSPVEQFKKDNIDLYAKLVNEKFTPEETNFYKNIFLMNNSNQLYSSISLSNELEGTITDISFQKGEFYPAAKYDFKFSLKLKNYPKDINIFYSKEDIDKIITTDATASGQQTNDYTQLKTGDKVKIKETYDLKQFHLIKAEIIKE